MFKKIKNSNKKAKDIGQTVGGLVHFTGMSFFKVIILVILSVVISGMCLIGWILLTSLLGKDKLILKRTSAWFVRNGIRNLKAGDVVTIKSFSKPIKVEKFSNGFVEDVKGGLIANNDNVAFCRYSIITHERKK
jgi:hypothetical protein